MLEACNGQGNCEKVKRTSEHCIYFKRTSEKCMFAIHFVQATKRKSSLVATSLHWRKNNEKALAESDGLHWSHQICTWARSPWPIVTQGVMNN